MINYITRNRGVPPENIIDLQILSRKRRNSDTSSRKVDQKLNIKNIDTDIDVEEAWKIIMKNI